MLKKITIIVSMVFTAILFYVAYKYDAINNFKFASPKDFVPYYEAAANQFWLVGMIICFTSWLWVAIVAIKTKQLFWLWIPFIFTVFVALRNSYHDEQLFHFKKANGLWNGGFSLSYFFGIGIILIAGLIILINYFGLKKYFQKEKKQMRI